MAYNVLKGSVEGSVDQHGNQEIDGIKIFKNTISASVFYDTDAQSPCATMKDVAIIKVNGGTRNSVLMMGPSQTAHTAHNFRYENDTLHVTNIVAHMLRGSAENLTNIPSDKFTDLIAADFLSHGAGLQNVRGVLQVKAYDGIKCDDDGVSINIAANSGLQLLSNKLSINPSGAPQVNSEGQNLSDIDTLLVHDASRNAVASTTLANLYNSYISEKVPHAVGSPGSLQYRGKKEFESSQNLLYDDSKNTLLINGKVHANCLTSQHKLVNQGAVYNNIVKVSDVNYEVKQSDYTMLCDASKNVVTVVLPPAANHVGRILNIKKANTNKYKLNSNLVYITCKEGSIDINDRVEIKMNYSSRTVQSDGENWWIIGSKGS
tara:strand:- start:242 stop:1369 length:1128 start_codon:yes stop_codon:yes gene_type:complete